MRPLIAILVLAVAGSVLSDDECMFVRTVVPDVLIIFDNSGSMTFDCVNDNYPYWGGDAYGDPTGGDGSVNYPGTDADGNGLADDSRMYILKQAMSDVVRGVSSFTNLGLVSFGFSEDNQPYPTQSGGWYDDPMVEPLDDTTMVITNELWGHISWPRRRRCWDVRVDDYPWWYRYDRTWTVEDTHFVWIDTIMDPARIHYRFLGCNAGGNVLVRTNAPHSADSILMWMDHREDVPWDLGQPELINKELRALSSTPLGGALYCARDYFRDERIPGDAASECRRYFVILITDGLETCGGNPVAAANALRSVLSAGTTYDIQTYVMAVAINNPSLDDIAEAGGTDQAYFAENREEIVNAMGEIFWQIRQKAFSFTAPEVVGIRGLRVGYQDKMYVASFIPSISPIWEGHLKSYTLPYDGILPVDEYGYPTIDPEWDAGDLLRERDPDSRTILTCDDGGMIDVHSLTPEDFGVPTEEMRDSIVALVYGTAHGDLGDIFHSTPVLIGSPNPFYVDEGYMEFRIDKKSSREWVIIAGANDGLFHAFSDSTGEELWAFCPPDLVPRLSDMLATHAYYVDGSASASDVWFPSNHLDAVKSYDEWHTVAIFGKRDGGTSYTALDLTYTGYPEYLFTLSDSSMGYTWSDVKIYKLRRELGNEILDRFYAFVGGGYWPDTLWDFNDPIGTGVRGNAVYFVNIWGAASGQDGIPDYHVLTYSGDDGSELEHMKWPFPGGATLAKSGDTRATFLSRYEYMYKDLLWIGDIKGQMWRVDMREPDPDDWGVSRLFVANVDVPGIHRPIFFSPATALDEDGTRWVYFGTGNRADPCGALEDNCFYAVRDGDHGEYLTTADLKKVSPGEAFDPAEPYLGWYVQFLDYGNGIGEKVYSSPVIVADTLYFTTFQPDETGLNPCESGSGVARLYKFHYLTGSFQGDVPYVEVGQGIPQTPVVSTDMFGNTVLVISCGEGGITTVRGALGEGKPKRTIWWRDIKGGPSRF